MTSLYMRTPSDFLIEHGWGGREVGPDWQPVELKSAGSFWGHQGLFESLGKSDAPPPMPAPEPNHTAAGDRRQLRAHERRLPLVGCGEARQ